MQMVEFDIGKKRKISIIPTNIVCVQTATKNKSTFISLIQGPKFTDYTIFEPYDTVVNKINAALEQDYYKGE